jgi:hypothetical protein
MPRRGADSHEPRKPRRWEDHRPARRAAMAAPRRHRRPEGRLASRPADYTARYVPGGPPGTRRTPVRGNTRDQTHTSGPSASTQSTARSASVTTSRSVTPTDKRRTCPLHSPWPQAQTPGIAPSDVSDAPTSAAARTIAADWAPQTNRSGTQLLATSRDRLSVRNSGSRVAHGNVP